MLKPFNHVNAKTVDEAVELLKKYKGKVKLIAGGTDLLGELKDQVLLTYPQVLINIKSIRGLDYIGKNEEGLRIGALATLADISDNPTVKGEYGVLAEAAKSVATPQIRNIGTIGGNLTQDTRCWYYRYPHKFGSSIMCQRKGSSSCMAVTGDNRYHAVFGAKKCVAVCPSDTAVALAALDATVKMTGPDGDRTVPVTEFFHPLGNALKSGEIVTQIQIPRPPDFTKQTFLKFRLREAVDFAIVSVASCITINSLFCQDARIVLGAVAAGPIRAVEAENAIINKVIDASTAETAAEASVSGTVPLSMNKYKVEIIKALIKRTLLS